MRRAVLQAKRGAPGALVDLLLARWPASELPLGATVTWIPAHPRRVLGRPDAGRILADALASRDGRVTEQLLWRVPWARRQAGRSDAARLASPSRLGLRAFGGAPSSVVLVDDVRTTGATLNRAADLLRAAGAAQVFAIAVATAPTGSWPAGHTSRPSGGR